MQLYSAPPSMEQYNKLYSGPSGLFKLFGNAVTTNILILYVFQILVFATENLCLTFFALQLQKEIHLLPQKHLTTQYHLTKEFSPNYQKLQVVS